MRPSDGTVAGPIFSADAVGVHVTRSGTLMIQGTGRKDSISLSTIKPSRGAIYWVTAPDGALNNTVPTIYITTKTGGVVTHTGIDGSVNVKRVYIEGGSGNDDIEIGSDVKLKAIIIGGNGDDLLIGGPLGDTISGGAGNDDILASYIPAVFHAHPLVPPEKFGPHPSGGKLYVPGMFQPTFIFTRYATLDYEIAERADSADKLEGDRGNDRISSGRGPDTIDGGAGNDHLSAQDRSYLPENLTTGGQSRFNLDGLTVISIENLDPIFMLD